MAAFLSNLHEESNEGRSNNIVIDWCTFRDTLIAWIHFYAPQLQESIKAQHGHMT
jgi:hypothetical protein